MIEPGKETLVNWGYDVKKEQINFSSGIVKTF
jgi:hypothetical protein